MRATTSFGLGVAVMAVVLIAALGCVGCKESAPNSDAASGRTNVPLEKILAIQAFVDLESDQRIMAICSSIARVEGYRSDLGGQFIPHITLASWIVTPHELQLAQSQFAGRAAGSNSVEVNLTLEEQDDGDRLSYFLLPEPTQALLQFHSQLHAKLGWEYEPWRQYDLPGKWNPHLTLFSIPKSQRHCVSDALLKLRKVRTVRIERVGLIAFAPTRMLGEVTLDKNEVRE